VERSLVCFVAEPEPERRGITYVPS
jgi:hypothetical protein